MKPTVFVCLEGGNIQSVHVLEGEANVIIADFDTDGVEEDQLTTLDGDDAQVHCIEPSALHPHVEQDLRALFPKLFKEA